MIDLHCHILPGIDDGPDSVKESLALAQAAVAAGTDTIVATPHVSWAFENEAVQIGEAVADLGWLLAEEGVELELRSGAEIAYGRAVELDDEQLRALALGGGPWILVEPPHSPVAAGLSEAFSHLMGRGHRVMVSHPERCAAFHREPQILHDLVAQGALCSLTAGSLVGHFGGPVRRFAQRLLRDGLAHNVASDAHNTWSRPPGVTAELARAGWGELARWLTEEVPAAMLAGEPIPPRPAVEGLRRGRWLRLR